MTDANPGGREPAPLVLKVFDKPLFRLGQILATPGAVETLDRLGVDPLSLVLGRHVLGDWGDLCDEDRDLNTHSLANGMRIFSSYKLSKPGDDATTETIWVITEANRSSTVLLLPGDY